MRKVQKLGIIKEVALLLVQQIITNKKTGEVCGLLVGVIDKSKMALAQVIVPMPNLSNRRNTFAINPEEFYRTRKGLEREGRRVLALYHSHPYGVTQPSFRDLELPKITNVLSLIVAPTEQGVNVACYGYANGKIYPVEVIAPIDELG